MGTFQKTERCAIHREESPPNENDTQKDLKTAAAPPQDNEALLLLPLGLSYCSQLNYTLLIRAK